MSEPNNPPAFPLITEISQSMYPGVQNVESTQGMTLRDYFAAKAMQGGLAGMLANSDVDVSKPPKWSMLAEHAFQAADAMLEERAK